jgi:hypothetical protein
VVVGGGGGGDDDDDISIDLRKKYELQVSHC